MVLNTAFSLILLKCWSDPSSICSDSSSGFSSRWHHLLLWALVFTLHHRHCPQMFFVNTKHISASGSLHFLLALAGITFLCKSKWLVFRSLLISSVSLSMPSCLHLQPTSCHPGPYLSSPNVLAYVSLTGREDPWFSLLFTVVSQCLEEDLSEHWHSVNLVEWRHRQAHTWISDVEDSKSIPVLRNPKLSESIVLWIYTVMAC